MLTLPNHLPAHQGELFEGLSPDALGLWSDLLDRALVPTALDANMLYTSGWNPTTVQRVRRAVWAMTRITQDRTIEVTFEWRPPIRSSVEGVITGRATNALVGGEAGQMCLVTGPGSHVWAVPVDRIVDMRVVR